MKNASISEKKCMTISDSEKSRFQFGKNWANFLNTFSSKRLEEAKISLCEALDCKDLNGLKFLDIGSGSGLFSLAAYQLGAIVYSFDYDQNSVECTKFLKQQYALNDNWTVELGSILDKDFLKKFGQVDLVYSWGVLHHTGNMYEAFDNVAQLLNTNGKLFISIYNDQGDPSKCWYWIKKTYNQSNEIIKLLLIFYTLFRCWTIRFIKDLLTTGNFLTTWRTYSKNRGMSAWHDLIDWVGGYPFEVARPEQVFDFFKERNFTLQYLKTCAGGVGCNEFIFSKNIVN